MYPIKLNNIYFTKIWGGRDLELFRDNLPQGNIGESWDVANHRNGTSIITNGEFKGMNLQQLIDLKGEAFIGTKLSKQWFPLLVKLINAKNELSVQVHPDDEYGKKIEGEMGKTEIWYVIEAFQGAALVVGTKECTKDQFKEAIKTGNLDEYLNKIPVSKGDVYFIKSGMIHAVGAGVIIAEIQQNSDITYRVYDYNRGRELHIDKALDVVKLDLKGEKIEGITKKFQGYSKTLYCKCKYFALELYNIETAVCEISDIERFSILTCVEGQGKIIYDHNKTEKINCGESIVIPAVLGAYEIRGKMKVLKCYVPSDI